MIRVRHLNSSAAHAMAVAITTLLAACGGGGGSSTPPPPPPATTYSVGGTISGLTASGLVLQDNGGDSVTAASGATSFTFATKLAGGAQYAVSVSAQPTGETCTVASGAGTIGSANVMNVAITCTATTPGTQSISGTVTGLTAAGLVLQDNGGDNFPVNANGTNFTFATPIASGSPYAVTILTQPSGETCQVANGSGTVGSSAINNVAITCTANAPGTQSISGTVTGLTAAGLVLQDNGGDNRTVLANGTGFTFATPIASGSPYAVTILTQPSGETCQVANGSGTVGSSAVNNVAVSCTPIPVQTFAISGTVTGLKGTGLVLTNNNANPTTVTAPMSGNTQPFAFSTQIASGSTYSVAVQTQPTAPAQHCTVTGAGSGTVTANVTNVAVKCVNVGQVVFVANRFDGASGDVSGFTINPTTGALTVVGNSPWAADNDPASVVVDPTGQYVYVGNRATLDVTAFELDTAGSGNLTFKANYPSTGVQPFSMLIRPDNQYLYAIGGGSPAGRTFSFTHNVSSGQLIGVTGSGQGVTALPLSSAMDPTGTFIFLPQPSHFVTAFTTNSDGTLSPTAQTAGGSIDANLNGVSGSAVWPRGTAAGGFLYMTGSTANQVGVYSYDSAGALTQQSVTATGAGPGGLAIDPTGTYLYVANATDGTISGYSINAQTGALTPVTGSPFLTGDGPANLVIDPSSQWLYSVNTTDGSVSQFSISASTGALTPIAPAIHTVPANSSGAGSVGIAIY